MYSVCLFCQRHLGANDAIEHFPVGRRLAFDSAKGRLWVICPSCGQWNLTPLEERSEAVEECERAFRGTTRRLHSRAALAWYDHLWCIGQGGRVRRHASR